MERDMAYIKSKRLRIVINRSNEVEHSAAEVGTSANATQQGGNSASATEMSNSSSNFDSSRTSNDHQNEYEYTVQDSNGIKRRDKTILADVWNVPEGHRIVVDINTKNQPIGDAGGVLGHFCGAIARNGQLCSLSYTRWDHLKKGGNRNNERMILQEVEKRSRRGKKSQEEAKVKPISTTGTKSHARVREELKKKLNKSPTRTQTYLECHRHEKEATLTNQIKDFFVQHGKQEVNIHDDPVSKVLGQDKYSRVRGLGLGVKPSDLVEKSVQSCKDLNMSSKDESVVLYHLRQLSKLIKKQGKQIKKQGKQIKKQGRNIMKLKRKILTDSDTDDLDSNESDDDDD